MIGKFSFLGFVFALTFIAVIDWEKHSAFTNTCFALLVLLSELVSYQLAMVSEESHWFWHIADCKNGYDFICLDDNENYLAAKIVEAIQIGSSVHYA